MVNCAGLVDFNPSLELALNVNVAGAAHGAELAKAAGSVLIHVSTAFVAGNRSGVVFEDEPIEGYFPRRGDVEGRPSQDDREARDPRDFDLDREIADCQRAIARVRQEVDDAAVVAELRARAQERLRGEGRGRGDEKAERLALGREKRLWISQRLVALGMERARAWGWPNTYTYTKSLGEQAIVRSGGRHVLVRPSIVETALRYPFPGWNEGFTTSAPLAFLGLKGHRVYPMGERTILDIVPVDLIAAGTLAVMAEAIGGAPERVYHLASGDVNPFYARRTVELVGLHRRRIFLRRESGQKLVNQLRARVEPYSVSRAHYRAFSTPALTRLAGAAARFLREEGRQWGAPRLSALASRAADAADEVESKLAQTELLFDLFMPFIWDNRYLFRCAHMRELFGRLSPEDQARLPWDPHAIDWRSYWLDVHLPGMEEWVFPGLEEESKRKVHGVRTHRDLLELFQASCQTHRQRVAVRMSGSRKERYTFGELRAAAERMAGSLAAAGVAKGDRVLLVSENRPEWPVAFFGILMAGGVVVPVDAQAPEPEVENLARSSGAKAALLSDEVELRLEELAARWQGGAGPQVLPLAEALAGDPARAPRVAPPGAEEVAALLYTSGTSSAPKGVLLTHRNFTSLVAKLASLFDVGPGDALLSVLPLHHTFELTCGMLVPFSRGAEVEYLDEITVDTLGDALESGRITAMIGVPALWSLLHRRITQELAARPAWVEGTAKALMGAHGSLRERLGVNLGKLLFWPVHRRLGGRLRLLVSGGSALDPAVQKAFHELGLDLQEGYGLTEAAPVLAVANPREDGLAAGVGHAIPGVELRIDAPDASGVGEVLARGPNVMLGYARAGASSPEVDEALTGEVLSDGWLRTGDLGRLDAAGRLVLCGRKKDLILSADGHNVYPDDVEELYRSEDLLKELSVVGLREGGPGAGGEEAGLHERVAMLAVPACRGRERAAVHQLIEAHVREVSARLPFHQRVKVWHLTEVELPRTATRKVKRDFVATELARLEALARRPERPEGARPAGGDAWLLDLVAEVSRRARDSVRLSSKLGGDLGFDSLMLTELAAALEQAGAPATVTEHLQSYDTVADLSRAVSASMPQVAARHAVQVTDPASTGGAARAGEERAGELLVPEPVAALGRRLLGLGQRILYRDVYATTVRGKGFIPHDRNFLVVANHQSHLDMGLVKVALEEEGSKLVALAAADYFFDTPLKRAYFENFTNLIPMDRAGSVRRSLRAAVAALRQGQHLLIFPEGTRSRGVEMASFKPTAGYLALHCGVDTLPVFLRGTHEALPAESLLPRSAKLEVIIGRPISVSELRRQTAELPRGEAHKEATRIMEAAVRALGGPAGGTAGGLP